MNNRFYFKKYMDNEIIVLVVSSKHNVWSEIIIIVDTFLIENIFFKIN